MLYGICNLSIVPLRLEASDASEMVSQILFGEEFKVLEKEKKWSKIELSFDGYIGYIDNKQYEEIDEETFNNLANSKHYYSTEIIDFVTTKENDLSTISIGSRLPFLRINILQLVQKIIFTKVMYIQKNWQRTKLFEKHFNF